MSKKQSTGLPTHPMERSVIADGDKLIERVVKGKYHVEFQSSQHGDYHAGRIVCEPATCPDEMPISQFHLMTFKFKDQIFWDTGEYGCFLSTAACRKLALANAKRPPRMTIAEAMAHETVDSHAVDEQRRRERLEEDAIINHALLILGGRLRDPNERTLLDEPDLVMDYLRLKLGPTTDHEVFGVLWLDESFRLIADEILAEGKRSEAHVDTKKVLRRAIEHDAHAALFYHNHPSGNPAPSDNDKAFTGKLAELLEMLEVKLLDHLIIGNSKDMPIASMRMQVKAEEEAEAEEKAHHPLHRLLESLLSGDAEVKVIHGETAPKELLGLLQALKAMRRH